MVPLRGGCPGWSRKQNICWKSIIRSSWTPDSHLNSTLPVTSPLPTSRSLKVSFLKRLNQGHSGIRGTRHSWGKGINLRTGIYQHSEVPWPPSFTWSPDFWKPVLYTLTRDIGRVFSQKRSCSRAKTHRYLLVVVPQCNRPTRVSYRVSKSSPFP